MILSPIFNKFREVLLLGEKDKFPKIVDYYNELFSGKKLTEDGLKEVVYFIADRKYKDAVNLDLLDKQFVLQHIQDSFKNMQDAVLDRKSFSKQIKDDALLLERDLYLDLNELDCFKVDPKDKFRISLLRKYGPTRQSQLDTPSRADFLENLTAENFKECAQIIICINIRRIANIKNMDAERIKKIIYRVMIKAKEKHLDIGYLSKYCKQESKYLPVKDNTDLVYEEKQFRNKINYKPVKR